MGLLAVALAALGFGAAVKVASSLGAPDVKPDDVDNPPRGRVWTDPKLRQLDVDAPGWYRDVLTQEGRYCGVECPCTAATMAGKADDISDGLGTKWRCRELAGEATPVPLAFRINVVKLQEPRVVAVDIRVVDVDGVVERTRVRTEKPTSGRRRGRLDVNEYELEGAARETVYCERLARQIAGASAGPYITRRKLPCTDLPATPAQGYTLYRAQRETTLNGPGDRIWEWFAKVRENDIAYPSRASLGAGGTYRGLYDLRLEVDARGVYVSGVVAPSVAPQRLRIEVAWRTRAP